MPTQNIVKNSPIKVHHSARRVRETLGGTENVQYFTDDWLISETLAMAGAVELLDPQLRAQILVRLKASQSLYL